MADDQASGSMDSLGNQGTSRKPEIVLQGQLLKLSRSRHWQERFFVFDSNQILTYSHDKEDATPRQCFRITRDSGCEVSDIYVEQRYKGSEKESLYCIKLSWPDDVSTVGSYNNIGSNKFHDSFKDDLSLPPPRPTFAADPGSPGSSRRKSGRFNDVLLSPFRPSKISRQRSAPAKPSNARTNADSKQRDIPACHTKTDGQRSGYGGSDLPDEQSITSSDTPVHQRGLRGWMNGKQRRNRANTDPFNQGVPDISNEQHALTSNGSIPSFVSMRHDSASIDGHETIHEKENEQDDEAASSPPTPVRHNMPQDSSDEFKKWTSTYGPGQGQHDDHNAAEQEKLHAAYFVSQRKEKKFYRKKVVAGTKIAVAAGAVAGVGVLTAGVGLAAGLVFLGAAAAVGGTAGVAEAGLKRKWQKSGKLTIATTSYEQTKLWKSSLDACLESESLMESTWGQLFVADGRKRTSALVPHDIEITYTRSKDATDSTPQKETKTTTSREAQDGPGRLFLKGKSMLDVAGAAWRPLECGWTSLLGPGAQSLRIFREERVRLDPASKKVARLAVSGSTCTPFKTQVVLNTAPLDAFMCIMSFARLPRSSRDEALVPRSGQSASFRVLEKIDDNTDIVHLVCRKLYLFPSWTEPRDFVLFRYWRYEPDGSYTICYESIEHKLCPPLSDYVRGQMHQAYTIAPLKSIDRQRKKATASNCLECLLTAVVQVDPKGWVPTTPLSFLSNQTYADAFGVSALLQILDIRDAIDHDRFLDASPELQMPGMQSLHTKNNSSSRERPPSDDFVNYDLRYANLERYDGANSDSLAGLETRPPPLSCDKWAEPDANSFLVRGPTYKNDRVKINAGASIGRLVAVDLVAVDKPILSGFSKHPKERIQLALHRERILKEQGKESDMPPFVFVVNIVLPGPPCYHAVYYYAVDDMSTIDGSSGTPSSRVCQKFLFGDSDHFRDMTFKLIPQIVEGNFMVRKAVGSTPAIMGTKLQQSYVRNSRYMEVILNCGSSAVATGVIRLSLGYAKTLVVDMGFLLEGDDDESLPERIFGCARMKYPEFGPGLLRKVEEPEEILNS